MKISKRLKEMDYDLESQIKDWLAREVIDAETVLAFVEDGALLAVEADSGKVVMEIHAEELDDFLSKADRIDAKEFRKRYKHNIQDELRNHENLLFLYLNAGESRQKSSAKPEKEQTKKKGARASEADAEESFSANGSHSPAEAVNFA